MNHQRGPTKEPEIRLSDHAIKKAHETAEDFLMRMAAQVLGEHRCDIVVRMAKSKGRWQMIAEEAVRAGQ